MNTFSGLMSRWTTTCMCNGRSELVAMVATSLTGGFPPLRSHRELSVALQEIHHEEDGTILCHIIVEHAHHASMGDLVGHVTLA